LPTNKENPEKIPREQTIAEDSLKEAAKKYRNLFNNIPIGFALCQMIFDKNGMPTDFRYLEINNAFERISGLKREVVLGKTAEELFPLVGKQHPGVMEMYGRVASTGKAEKIELYFKPFSIWLEISASSTEKGYFLAIFEDITDRKKAEEALRKSESRFRSLYENSFDAVLLTKPDGQILAANSVAQRMFGMSEEEIQKAGRNGVVVIDERAEPALRERARTGKAKAEFTFRRKDGSTFEGETASSIFTDSDGSVKTSMIIRDVTERKKAEAAIKQSEENYRQLFSSMTEMFQVIELIYDENGKAFDYYYRNVNPAFEKLVGKTREQLVDKRAKDLFGIVENYWIEVYDKVAKTGKSTHFENYGAELDKWYEINAWKTNDKQVAIIFTDVTDRKKAEEKLAESKELLVETEQTGKIGGWEFDVKTLKQTWTEQTFRILEVDTLQGEPQVPQGIEFINQPYRDMANQAIQRAIEYGEPYDQEWEVTTFKGSKRWVHSVGKVRKKKGVTVGLYGSFQDITERKKAEEALRENEQLYRAVFDNSEDAFELIELIYDKDGKPIDQRYLKINRAFINQTGIKEVDLTSKTAKQILPNVEPYWFEIPDKVLKTGKTMHTESYNQDTKRYYDIYFFRYSENTVGGLFRDVTERKVLEKKLQDSERLAAIGATAGMVGHDIRNPLQAITGDLFLAKSELANLPDNDQKQNTLESLGEIEKNVDYINKIVADLQDYARPLNPRTQETNLKSVLNEIAIKNGIPKNIKLTIEIDDKAETIIADPDYLKRIFSNLTLNAVQAMPEGGKLTIRAYCDKATNDILVTVKDTGVGIPEDVKPKLFTPMMTTKSKGQGFGLAVVKRMTEGLGGTVTFESQEGKGTTFIVRLPPQKS
jgi:PAS domain S-box-containing protein